MTVGSAYPLSDLYCSFFSDQKGRIRDATEQGNEEARHYGLWLLACQSLVEWHKYYVLQVNCMHHDPITAIQNTPLTPNSVESTVQQLPVRRYPIASRLSIPFHKPTRLVSMHSKRTSDTHPLQQGPLTPCKPCHRSLLSLRLSKHSPPLPHAPDPMHHAAVTK